VEASGKAPTTFDFQPRRVMEELDHIAVAVDDAGRTKKTDVVHKHIQLDNEDAGSMGIGTVCRVVGVALC